MHSVPERARPCRQHVVIRRDENKGARQSNCRKDADEFVRDNRRDFKYRVAEENGTTILRSFTDTSAPTIAIIDSDGRLAWIWPGSEPPLEKVIDLMLKGDYRLAP